MENKGVFTLPIEYYYVNMPTINVKSTLLRSYRRLLQPLLRILMRNGIKYSEIVETVQIAMVEVSARQSPLSSGLTLEQIAAETGISVSTVRDVLAASFSDTGEIGPEENEMVGRVLEGWHRDEGYVGIYGMPNEIDKIEFDELCLRHAPKVSSDRLLDLMIEAACVKELPDIETNENRYRCVERTYISKPITQPHIERLGTILTNLVNTVDRNSFSEHSPLVEKRVWRASGLSPVYLESFDKQIREKSDEFLLSLDNWLSTCHEEEDDGQNLVQTGVNVFHYIEEEDERKPLQEVLVEKGISKEQLTD